MGPGPGATPEAGAPYLDSTCGRNTADASLFTGTRREMTQRNPRRRPATGRDQLLLAREVEILDWPRVRRPMVTMTAWLGSEL